MDKLTLLVDVRILSDKIKQLEADKESIEKDRLAIATKYNNQMIKIKQLEAEFEMITKDRDDRVHELYESNEENQRLTEAIEFEINQPMQIARQQERLQKALEGL